MFSIYLIGVAVSWMIVFFLMGRAKYTDDIEGLMILLLVAFIWPIAIAFAIPYMAGEYSRKIWK